MYLNHYGLKEFPFNLTPDPRYIHWTAQHRDAFDHLLYGIQARKGFVAFTGEVGSGKTTLCRAVLAELGDRVSTALLLNPSLSGMQLLRAMLKDFGLETSKRDRLDYIEVLNDFLLRKNREGCNVALVIDEAQNLSPEVMEQVRLLSNLETDQHKLIQIVLCGQPELSQRLNRPDLRQLRQRITVRFHLEPLAREDLEDYVLHRLAVAGCDGGTCFKSSALREIHRYASGSPRMVNAVCDGALMAGYVAGTRTIEAGHVKRAVKLLEG